MPLADGIATVFGHVVAGHEYRLGTQRLVQPRQRGGQVVELACPLATARRKQTVGQVETCKALVVSGCADEQFTQCAVALEHGGLIACASCHSQAVKKPPSGMVPVPASEVGSTQSQGDLRLDGAVP